ncbi:MAG: helix-turn-helix domain-containing protein [Sporomusaceae bacterium]|nr:helix-turn-helix domain-containing protein [Sporomusaceae bacterium]
MTVSDRLYIIIKENNLKQKEFAASLKVSESYISKLLRQNNINISAQFLELLEEKFGYRSEWVLLGKKPKFKNTSRNKELSNIHKQVINQVEEMSVPKLQAVLAFINSLEEVYGNTKKDERFLK